MNIFKILSSGDGSIKEPNVSAFLGYLLDPNKEHGLKDFLLKTFLEKLIEENTITSLMINDSIVNLTNDSDFKIDVELERKVTLTSGKKRDIDIVINIFYKSDLIFVLCIENKIKVSSVTENQLNEQLEGIQQDVDINKIGFVYLTPESCLKCNEEFESFKTSHSDTPAVHLSWNEDIYNLLVNMLEEESKGIIEPIFEYSKYTIKAFMNFIKTDFQSYKEEKSNINKKDNTKYNFNNRTNLSKGKLILELVKKHVFDNPDIDLINLKTHFSRSIASKVIESLVEARKIKYNNGKSRYFTSVTDIITLKDGTKTVVYAGWSANSNDFKKALILAKQLDSNFIEVRK